MNTWSNDPADAGRRYQFVKLHHDTIPYDLGKDVIRNQPWEDTVRPFADARGHVTSVVQPHAWRPTIVRSHVTVRTRPPLARRKRRSLLPELVIALLVASVAFAVGRWAR